MNETILIPDFSCGEPNLTSTRKKNEDGKCCFHHCDNPLPKEEYIYMTSFLACEECGKKLQKEMKAMEDEANRETIQRLMSMLDIKQIETAI